MSRRKASYGCASVNSDTNGALIFASARRRKALTVRFLEDAPRSTRSKRRTRILGMAQRLGPTTPSTCHTAGVPVILCGGPSHVRAETRHAHPEDDGLTAIDAQTEVVCADIRIADSGGILKRRALYVWCSGAEATVRMKMTSETPRQKESS